MKKHLLIFLGFLLFPVLLRAQDKLLLQNGTEIPAKVLQITPDSVHFTVADSAKGQALSKAEVFLVRFQNGTWEVFDQQPQPVEKTGFNNQAKSNIPYSYNQFYQLGKRDAKIYFKAGGTFWGTFGATVGGTPFIGPTAGIATGIACAATAPPDHNIIPSNRELLLEPAYLDGYRNQAKKKKLGNAAGGVLAGTGTVTVIILYLISSAFH